MSGIRFALRQAVYTNKAFWRNPASAFFTFAFPLMFLVIFTTLFGNSDTPTAAGTIKTSTFYIPGMATFAVISACYTNIAISVAYARDEGILKRTRGTPMPGWSYLLGRVLHAMVIAVVLVVIVGAFGKFIYDAQLPTGTPLVQFLIALVVGSGAFAALGLALTCVIPNADASPAIVNASILPLLFLSDVFIPLGRDPAAWVNAIGVIFPVRHFANAMQAAFLGAPFSWSDVLVVALWGIGGLLVAARYFRWEPRH
ncbi:MAG: ABC transporter permease [Actinomycetota bacterium]